MMRVLQITAWDSRGEQFNGCQIHRALKDTGHESHMAVMHAELEDETVHRLGNRVTSRLDPYLVSLERKLSLYACLPLSAATLYSAPYYRSADIVHLQLIHAQSFFSLWNLPIIGRQKRLVWTLHDPWMMSGHCVHSLDCERWKTGCGSCPDLALSFPVKRDTTAWTWKMKRRVMKRTPVTLVVHSEWMHERARQSPILRHLPCHVIPIGLDADRFRPLDKSECKASFGVPQDASVLALRYRGKEEPFKGWSWLEEALLSPGIPATHLITFDEKGIPAAVRDRYRVVELGWVEDQDTVCKAMNAADVFVMPSVAEAFGMMAVESMACGTPVIAFEGTALPGVIHAGEAGVAVPNRNAGALAEAIRALLQDSSLRDRLARAGRQLVEREYTSQLYIQRHLALYGELMNLEPGTTCERN